MQNLELPLFTVEKSRSILNDLPQETSSSQTSLHSINPQTPFENALNVLFPQQSEEDKIARIRRLLGEIAKTLSDPQIETIITEFQYLIDAWLDEYEKEVFNGLTLKEVLSED